MSDEIKSTESPNPEEKESLQDKKNKPTDIEKREPRQETIEIDDLYRRQQLDASLKNMQETRDPADLAEDQALYAQLQAERKKPSGLAYQAGSFFEGLGGGTWNTGVSTVDFFWSGVAGQPSLDKYLYEPAGIGGSLGATLAQGVGSYLGGKAIAQKGVKIVKDLKKEAPKGKPLGTTSSTMKSRSWAHTGKAMLKGVGYSAVGDFFGWHPSQGNLGTYLAEVSARKNWKTTNPGMHNLITDIMAIPAEDWANKRADLTSQFVDRFRQLGEGAILGAAAEGIVIGISKYRIRKAAIKAHEKLLKEEERLIEDMSNKELTDQELTLRVKDNDKLREDLADKVLTADKELAWVPDEVEMAARVELDRQRSMFSGFGIPPTVAMPVEELTGPAIKFNREFGGGVQDVDFNSQGISKLYDIHPDGKGIYLDRKAIENDYKEGLTFLRGERLEGRGLSSRSVSIQSREELEILDNLGVSPTKLAEKFKQLGHVEGPKHYAQFFENRGRQVIRLCRKYNVDPRHVSLKNPKTRHILTEATFEALVAHPNKGGFGWGGKQRDISRFKSDLNRFITPKGPQNIEHRVGQILFGTAADNESGRSAKQIQDALADLRNPETPTNLDDIVNKLGTSGWAWHTSDENTNLVLASLSQLFEKEFKAGLGKPEKLATSLGWKKSISGAASAEDFIASNLDESISALASQLELDKGVLTRLIAEAGGSFGEGGAVQAIKWSPKSGFKDADLRTMHARVMAVRVRMKANAAQIDGISKKITDNIEKGIKGPEGEAVLQRHRIALIRAVTQEMSDMEDLAMARSSAGRLLRAFRQYDVLTKAGIDASQQKKLEEKLFEIVGGPEGADNMAFKIQLAKTEHTISKATLAKQIREYTLLEKASGFQGLGDAFVDVLINSMLSSFTTQAINLSSSLIKRTGQNIGRFAAATFIPTDPNSLSPFRALSDAMYGDVLDPISKKVMTKEATRAFVKDTARRDLFETFLMAGEILRTFARAGDDGTVYATKNASEISVNRQQEAYDSIHGGAAVDRDHTKSFGGEHTAHELEATLGKGTSEAIGANLLRIADDRIGPKAYQWALNTRKNAGIQALAKAWDWGYEGIIRQPIRKMVAMDTVLKRLFYRSRAHSTLAAHGAMQGLEGDELGAYIIKMQDNMILKNGQPFSKDNLTNLALEEFESLLRVDKVSLRDKDEFINRYINDNWDMFEPGSDVLIMGGHEREALAKQFLDDATETTYQRNLDADEEDIIGAAQEARRPKNLGETKDFDISKSPPPENLSSRQYATLGQGISAGVAGNALLKVFAPFIRTPLNIWKDGLSLFPLIGAATRKHRAALLSNDPMKRADAYGRQILGFAIAGTAYGLIANGRMTGNRKRDPRQQAVFENADWRQNTFILPDGSKFDYSRLEPANIPLKIYASYYEAMEATEFLPEQRQQLQDHFFAINATILDAMKDSTYAKDLATMFSVLDGMSETDEASDTMQKLFEDKLLQVVPNLFAKTTDAYDSQMREAYTGWEKIQKRFFPWGLPPKRDPILGRALNKDHSWFTPKQRAVLPFKLTKKTVGKAVRVYSELAQMHNFIDAPQRNIQGFPQLNTTKFNASIDHKDPKKDLKLEVLATNFKAPGGEPCPVRRGQSFYDFYQQYIGQRKVPLNSIEVSHWRDNILSGYEGEERERVSKLFDNLEDSIKKDNLVSLEEVLLLVISSDAYQAADPRASILLNQESKRTALLRSIVSSWRAESMKELLGEDIDLDKSTPIIKRGKSGPIGLFWPNLAALTGAYTIAQAAYDGVPEEEMEDNETNIKDAMAREDLLGGED